MNPLNPRTDIAFVPGKMFGELNVTGITDIGTDRTNPKVFGQDLYQFTDQLLLRPRPSRDENGDRLAEFPLRRRVRQPQPRPPAVPQRVRFPERRHAAVRDREAGSDFERHYRQNLIGAWLQDDIKATGTVTINAGVRYEMVTTPHERDGKVSNLRNLTDPAVTVGDPLFLNPTKKQFAPRLGFAWNVGGRGKTAVRGGYGIFYEEPLFYQCTAARSSARCRSSIARSSRGRRCP